MNTQQMMTVTVAALLPGIATYSWLFGWGVLINILAAVFFALLFELICLCARQQPLTPTTDGSCILTAVLLALCLPPLLPVTHLIIGVFFAIIVAKHLYGGLGHNLFNPAMVGFAVLIVAFPLTMSHWPAEPMTLKQVMLMKTGLHEAADGVTRATPLDAFKFREGITTREFFSADQTSNWHQWLAVNVSFLLGGIFLLWKRIINWRAPVGFLVVTVLLATFFYDAGSSASTGSPLFHVTAGAAMLAAFFIVTDPVTSPSMQTGLLIFGAGVGLITFIIRIAGAYPEGVAFAVLLMNAASPLIDHVLQPSESGVPS